MRFVTFETDGQQRPGLMIDEQSILDLQRAFVIAVSRGIVGADIGGAESLIDVINGGDTLLAACGVVLDHAADADFAPARLSVDNVSLTAPIPRPAKNVFCVGSNYRAHVAEGARAQNKEYQTPEHPVFFTKPPTAVIGPGGTIEIDASVSEKMDYEVELAVVIGKVGRNISKADAAAHIFGFTIINDVSARDIQRRHGGQYLKGKGLDTSCPMGPHIVTFDEVPDYQNLSIGCSVNGEKRQDGNTANMIFLIDRLLESLSEGMTLEPGDILATGTPSGVGYAMEPPRFLGGGDTITCEIEGIGQLTNVVREIAAAGSGPLQQRVRIDAG